MFQYDPMDEKREPFTRPPQRPQPPTTERIGRPPSLLGLASGMGAAFQGRPPQQSGQDPVGPALGAFARQAQPVARGGPLPAPGVGSALPFVGRSISSMFNPRTIVGTAPQQPKPPQPDPPEKWDPATNPGTGGPAFMGRPPQPDPPQMEPPQSDPATLGQYAKEAMGRMEQPPADTAPGWRRRAFLERLRSADESTPSPMPMTKFQRRKLGGPGGPAGPPPATY